jgi:hypothetical protein
MPEQIPAENAEQPKEAPRETPKEAPEVEPTVKVETEDFAKKIEKEEPKTRFPRKEQSPQEKEEGYKFRQWKKDMKKKVDAGESIDDADLTDEDDKPITRKEFNQMMEESNKKQSSETMLQEFLVENPDYRKYAPLLRKHLNDPAYHNVPIGFIANGIKGNYMDDEINERAELKKKADMEANNSKSGGSSKRVGTGAKKKVADMSKDEFEAYQAEVLARR